MRMCSCCKRPRDRRLFNKYKWLCDICIEIKRKIKEAKKIITAQRKSTAIRIYNSQNKEKYKAYRRINKERYAFHTAQRNAAKIQRTPPWLTKSKKEIMKSFYKQAADKTKETKIAHAVDHIIPLQGKIVSGLNVPWNLQILTSSENSRKSNKFYS